MKEYFSKYNSLALALLLGLTILSAYLFQSLYKHQQTLVDVQNNRYDSYLLATQLRRSSDDLTRLVRTYAATGNSKYEKHFFDVLAIRNGKSPLPYYYDRIYWDFLAVEKGVPPYALGDPISLVSLMYRAGFTEDEFLLLEESRQQSDDLVRLETIAINAMKGRFQDENGGFSNEGSPNKSMAIDILYGEEYHKAKINIMSPINQFYERLDLRTSNQVNHASKSLDSTRTFLGCIFALIIGTIILLISSSRRYHANLVKELHDRVEKRTEELNSTNQDLKKALSEIRTLEGLIPICMYCHSIRNDAGAWNQLESYIENHSDAQFSHGICPECKPKFYADMNTRLPKKV